MNESRDPAAFEAIGRRVSELQPWFHNLHLPGGIETAPDSYLGDFPAYKWAELAGLVPSDMRGWSVLDIGCNAGFYSFELARRGARVTALDMNPHYLEQARWAAGVYGLDKAVTFRRMQVYDLAREPGIYDLVLFLGVFYHLRYPLLALDVVRRKTGRMLVFQSLSIPDAPEGRADEAAGPPPPENLPFARRREMARDSWPKMAFIEHSLADDPSNWWAPSAACVEALLRCCGLRVTARPGEETYVCEIDPARPHLRHPWDVEEFMSAMGLMPGAGLP